MEKDEQFEKGFNPLRKEIVDLNEDMFCLW